ncbi:MAG TPA: hypothetical protein VK993_13840 [Chthoniobacterales bacterium]|nr:hypothetical protein [Chthoniobacterales bacterium]
MNRALRLIVPLQLAIAAFLSSGCASRSPQGIQQVNTAAAAAIQSEAPGDYYIGRRYYKAQYKFWGYIRRPGQPWSTAQLAMVNEHQKLAPDRAQNNLGSDDGHEYKLFGTFSPDKVYEPASNGFYPEFILRDYQLVSTNPPPIFPSQTNAQAKARLRPLTIERPQ